jgi:hypothetical protein
VVIPLTLVLVGLADYGSIGECYGPDLPLNFWSWFKVGVALVGVLFFVSIITAYWPDKEKDPLE